MMNHRKLLSITRQVFLVILTGLLMLAVFLTFTKPVSADSHYQSGDLIKGSQSTVYYYSEDGQSAQFALDRFSDDACPGDKDLRSVVNQIEPGRCE